MQTAKSTGMGIGCLQHLTGPDADTGITFSAAGSAITHLGIPLSTDPDAAARALYTGILQRLDRRIARWSGFRLSLLGRAHVAKQVLVSIVHLPWHLCLFYFFGVKKAYMIIDANHVSNPKDR